VVHGNKLGGELGFPTANLEITDDKKLVPAHGIYAVNIFMSGVAYRGMLYIGSKPTLGSNGQTVIEVNIFNFRESIYNHDIRIELLQFIRPDKKFDDLTKLRDELENDKIKVLSFFGDHPIDTSPSVGIVILNYNGRKVLERYIDTFKNIDYANVSVVVVDNKSTDNSVPYLKNHHPDIKVIQLHRNHGFAAGYNLALEQLEFDYYAIVNSDVELTPNWLNPIIKKMEEDPTVAACQPKILNALDRTKFEYAGGSGGWIDRYGYPFCRGRILNTLESDSAQYNNVEDIFWASGAASVIRAKLFHQFHGFDQDYFAHQEEIDLCWRFKKAGYRILAIPSSVIYHEGGATLSYQNPKKVFLNFRNNLATIFKNMEMPLLLLILFSRLILDALAGINFLSKGQWKNCLAIIHAHLTFYTWLPLLMRKRKMYQSIIDKHNIGSKDSRGEFKQSILYQYYFLRRKRFSDLPIDK
jgi:GT2 family glycosyltransferase